MKYKYKVINDAVLCVIEQYVEDQVGEGSTTIRRHPTFVRVLFNRGIYEEMEEMRDEFLEELTDLFPDYNFEIDITRSVMEVYSC